jgi:hypothetical protein
MPRLWLCEYPNRYIGDKELAWTPPSCRVWRTPVRLDSPSRASRKRERQFVVPGGVRVRLSGGLFAPRFHNLFHPRTSVAYTIRAHFHASLCPAGMADYRSDVVQGKTQKPNPGNGTGPPPDSQPRTQVKERAGRITPFSSSAMSSGRLFLDRVGRHQSPSLLHRHRQHNLIARPKEMNYHRAENSVLTVCLSSGGRRNHRVRTLLRRPSRRRSLRVTFDCVRTRSTRCSLRGVL